MDLRQRYLKFGARGPANVLGSSHDDQSPESLRKGLESARRGVLKSP